MMLASLQDSIALPVVHYLGPFLSLLSLISLLILRYPTYDLSVNPIFLHSPENKKSYNFTDIHTSCNIIKQDNKIIPPIIQYYPLITILFFLVINVILL